eukprot:CAMPEP_0171310970 /NCGR_PEP_ID=MMETSP0816-20121228/21182_1 /TAXON_ID=420281 /ORGANISM="Proboscia inermis, Strain CCAP1064/1" /LENGTH=352 /DNA_ID=CAMNT_0011795419 /DNA_START=18 /DNA_END=1076 /DNA_ORIENTATION=+
MMRIFILASILAPSIAFTTHSHARLNKISVSSLLKSYIDSLETSDPSVDTSSAEEVPVKSGNIDFTPKEVRTPVDSTTPLKTNLLLLSAGSDRGQNLPTSQKLKALELINELEELNPNPNPLSESSSSSSLGTWELVYSSTQLFRSSPFFMAGRAVCSTEDEARQYDWFCDMHRGALAISTIGKVRQIISATRMTSEFEVKVGSVPFLSDFTPFAYSGGWPVTIEGTIVSSADITPCLDGTAWEIFMDTVEIKGSNIPGLRQILDAGVKLGSRDLGSFLETNVDSYTNPKPIFRTTYLDDQIRISRDQDNKVFVYGKISDETDASDYSGIMADLGVAKLLEGFNDAVIKYYI